VNGVYFGRVDCVPLSGGAGQLLRESALFSRLRRLIRRGAYDRVI